MIYPLLPAFLTGTLRAGPAFLGVVEGLAETVAAALKIVSGRRLGPAPPPQAARGRRLRALLARAPPGRARHRSRARPRGAPPRPRGQGRAQRAPRRARGRGRAAARTAAAPSASSGPWTTPARWWARSCLRGDARDERPAGRLRPRRRPRRPRRPPPSSSGCGRSRGRPRPDRRARGAAAAAALEPALLRYLGVLALFTLGNSSDAFLLLRAQETGVALAAIPALWALHHLVKAGASTWGGALSDRVGRRRVILAGWGVYALAYAGLRGRPPRRSRSSGLFAFYGLFHALTEGAERALVADLAGEATRGRAFGLFHAVTGAALLPASLLTGVLWQRFGAPVALGHGRRSRRPRRARPPRPRARAGGRGERAVDAAGPRLSSARRTPKARPPCPPPRPRPPERSTSAARSRSSPRTRSGSRRS